MVRLARKDLRLATEMGRAAGVPMRVTEEALAALGRCVDAGWGAEDVTALLKLVEQPAGVRVRKEAE
jgi:4-hydroxybutyrate dehydrogenase/sulfolactaldehyde 3-reductase